MSKKTGLIIAALLLMPVPTVANAETEILGVGTGSCVQFAEAYRRNPAATEKHYYTWFEGFATGLNLLLKPPKNLNVNMTDQWVALRMYCNQHPLGGFYEAAMKVMADLPERKTP